MRRYNQQEPGLTVTVRIRILKIFAYLLALAIIGVVALKMDGDEAPEPVGTLDERFLPVATIESGGLTLNYREQQVENILIIGVDRAEILQTDEDYQNGGQADFLFLLSIDSRNRRTEIIQIDRDTIAEIRIYGAFGNPAGTRTTQICLAQAFGADISANCENTCEAVSRFLYSIPIDHYIALDMSAIRLLNDAIGGVTVTLDEDFSSIDPAMRKGTTLTLRGEQAEIYVRTRMEIGSTNAQRMQRQQTYINAAMEILLTEMEEDLNFIGRLFDAMDGHMVTDADEGWLINKAYAARQYEFGEVITLAGTHSIGTDGFVEFYADEEALKALIAGIYFE